MAVPFVTRAGVVAAVLLGISLPIGAQPPPPPRPAPPSIAGQPRDPGRRPPPEPTGTGIIRGRVVAGDSGNPMRRASVTLMPAPDSTATTANGTPVNMTGANVIRPKSVTTDAQGGFEFAGLPAGIYRLVASAGQYSAAYIGMAYGGKRPVGPGADMGSPIVLADGQTFAKATIGLQRGAVITGRVTDDTGDPLARISVSTLLFQPGNSRGQRSGSGAQTDDLGHFRIYGLSPGDYAVVAEVRGNTFVQPNAPPQSEEDRIGLMTTYFPATADEGSAQRVRARAGTETPGVEIRMTTGRLYQISGTVVDSLGRPAARVSGNLWRRSAGSMGSSSFGFNTDEQGRFQMRNVPPGSFRLFLQQRSQAVNADGSRNEADEMATLPLTLAADIDNLMIVTTPAATITGQVVFEQGPPAQTPQGFRIHATLGNPEDGPGMSSPQPAVVAPDLTFSMRGFLGEWLLRTGAPNQYLKAVMLGGEDITDTPREFKTGDKVTIVLTSRASTLEGHVTDAAGRPVTEAALILFSEDKASWRATSVNTRRSGTDQAGHYRISGLMAGRYFVAAVPREQLGAFPPAPDFFEQLSKEATRLVIGDDEQRQVDLKLLAGGGN